MWRLARRLCQQDACNDPETLFTGEKYPRERMYIYIYTYVESRSRFHAKRFLRKWARERRMVDVCNVTRSRRGDIFSSRPEECRFPLPVKNYSGRKMQLGAHRHAVAIRVSFPVSEIRSLTTVSCWLRKT